MSSINHFLTTKTGTTDIPQCPPGFVYNADTEKCVRLIDVTEDAVVSVDEIAIGVPDRCPEGFTFNEEAGVCENITEAPADCGELATVLKSGTNVNYGKFGARFYESTLGRPLPIEATSAIACSPNSLSSKNVAFKRCTSWYSELSLSSKLA